VNKVVVVAHRGFAEEAINRARDGDIEQAISAAARLFKRIGADPAFRQPSRG
jgi:hypothetical protein